MLRRAAGLLVTTCLGLVLAACGGGDDSFTSSGSSGDGGGGDPTGVASITLLASTPTLPSDPNSTVTLTAIARDSGNQVLEDVSVVFTATSGSIAVTQGTTDASGQATAVLSPGGDPSNRTITLTASSGNASASLDIAVTGTTIDISGPNSLVQGATGQWTITLRDAASSAISGRPVNVTSSAGNTISASSLTTNAQGVATVDVTATVTGPDTLTASALGETDTADFTVSSDVFQFTDPAANTEIPLNTAQNVTVQWTQNGTGVNGQTINFTSTRGSLGSFTATTDANGNATVTIQSNNAGFATITAEDAGGNVSATLRVEFVATVPDSLDLQANPSAIQTNGASTLTAIVRDPNNNLVKNATVDFTLTDITNGTLSVGSAVTDSLGRASTTYTASNTPSANNGVRVDALVRGTAVQGTAFLTVGQRSLRISLGTGNEIQQLDPTSYSMPWAVIVTDADGNPVTNQQIQMTALATRFFKGYWAVSVDDTWVSVWLSPAGCPNEDTNLNGILDPLEDVNGNGVLDPGNVAAVDRGNLTTDSAGRATFNLNYAETYGAWVEYQLTARVQVSGTEQSQSATFILPVLASDTQSTDQAPPGGTGLSPFGSTSAACTDTL